MTAVLASYVKMSTLVDGTMRVVLDIEPTAAPEAFAMLGAPGSPIALARITDAAAVAQDRKSQEATEKKPLSLASKIALTCQQPTFYDFLTSSSSGMLFEVREAKGRLSKATAPNSDYGDDDICAEVVRHHCGVRSRADINADPSARNIWFGLEASYHDWQRRRSA